MSLRHVSSDKCLTVLFLLHGGRKPLAPLFRVHADLNWRITMCFGEKDPFTREPADQLVKEGIIRGSVHSIKGTGHHLYMDNAELTLKSMLKGFFELEKEE